MEVVRGEQKERLAQDLGMVGGSLGGLEVDGPRGTGSPRRPPERGTDLLCFSESNFDFVLIACAFCCFVYNHAIVVHDILVKPIY